MTSLLFSLLPYLAGIAQHAAVIVAHLAGTR